MSPRRVWELVSDPYHLPRWWPRCVRVENVTGGEGERRTRWTMVLATEKGSTVRADYRCLSAAAEERYIWAQELEGTPFERILQESVTDIRIEPADGGSDTARARLTMTSRQRLRGLSRLGAPMMRRGTGRNLEAALDGLEAALT